jgi:hypothetical protein
MSLISWSQWCRSQFVRNRAASGIRRNSQLRSLCIEQLESRLLLTVNTAPVILDQSFTLQSTTPTGVLVGTITASDADVPADILSYQVTSANNGAFAIDSNGNITVANPALLSSQIAPVLLTVQVTDNGSPHLFDSATIRINVNHPPQFTVGNFVLPAIAGSGANVGQVTAVDPDPGQTLTYSILAGNETNVFSLNPSTGQLSVSNASLLNSVSFPKVLSIEVHDDSAAQGEATATITIDANHPPVVNVQTIPLLSNVTLTTTVATVTSSDPDVGQTRTFAITAGNNGAFLINSATGEISVVNAALLVKQSILTVQVTDNGTPSLSATGLITITVNTVPSIVAQTFPVPVAVISGQEIGTVVATDADTANGQLLTFSITSGDPTSAFSINSTTGKITVANLTAFNALSFPVPLLVKVADNGSPVGTKSAIITITGNNAPVIANQTLTVPISVQTGTVIGTVNASELDVGQQLTYAITAGNTAGAFAINSTTGVIKIADKTAYDALTFPQALTVQVQDNGIPQRTASATITIAGNHPPVINNQSFSVPATVGVGTTVAQLVYSDVDNMTGLTFSLTVGNESGAFSINNTGLITVADPVVFNTLVFPAVLTVTVTDNGNPQGIDTALVTLNRVIKYGTVSGVVFSDTNENGIRDPGEPGKSDVTVYIDYNEDGTFDGNDTQTTTDSNGVYSISNVPSGPFQVRMEASNGQQANPVNLNLVDGANLKNEDLALPPQIRLNQLPLTYTTGMSPIAVATNTSISARDDLNYQSGDDAVLTVRVSGAQQHDRLTLAHPASGDINVVHGKDVTYKGTVIGRLTTPHPQVAVQITFDRNLFSTLGIQALGEILNDVRFSTRRNRESNSHASVHLQLQLGSQTIESSRSLHIVKFHK